MVQRALTLLMIGAGLAWPSPADACSCSLPQPCRAIASASFAFIGTVTADVPVKKFEAAARVGTRRYRIAVERVFRGAPARMIELISGGDGFSCNGYTFTRGRRYLVYATKKNGFFTTHMCGASPIESAGDHLTHLSRTITGEETIRVSGVMNLDVLDIATQQRHARMRDIIVTIRSANGFTRETKTDAGGSFAFSAVPVRPFTVTAKPPRPFAVMSGDEPHDAPDPRACPFVLLNVRFDGRVAGKVLDAAGLPLANLLVQARRAALVNEQPAETRTDANGEYQFEGLRPGEYHVGVNIDRPPSNEAPYLSGPAAGSKARTRVTVTLAEGQHTRVSTLTMEPPLTPLTMKGCVALSDGRLVNEASVWIKWSRDTPEPSRFEWIVLDERGCFSTHAYPGNSYQLNASWVDGSRETWRRTTSGTIAASMEPETIVLERVVPRRR